MDKINQKIVTILQSNARVSFAELAKQVHLSAPAVAERVKRLEEQGVIAGYSAKVDCHALGLPILALVQIKVFTGKEPALIAFAKSRKEVIEGFNVTGERAFILKVATSSMKALDSLLEDISKIAESNTMMILSEITSKSIEFSGQPL